MGFQSFDEKKLVVTVRYLVDGTWTVKTDLIGSNDMYDVRVDTVLCQNSETSPITLEFGFAWLIGGSLSHDAIGRVTLPASAGDGTVPLYDAIPDLTSPTQPAILLPQGAQLYVVGVDTAPTGAQLIFHCQGGVL